MPCTWSVYCLGIAFFPDKYMIALKHKEGFQTKEPIGLVLRLASEPLDLTYCL